MKTRRATRLSCERGATLVHVAVALVSLMGMLAYAVDRGIVWISRGQAQNAADAGALAAAVARGFDEFTNPPASGGLAETAALAVAGANSVWGVPASVRVSWPVCPIGVVGTRCVRVDVYRNGEFSSASLPVIFGPILGITQQGVRATATAVVDYGNTVHCMRPLAIPDKWIEHYAPGDEYNHWAAPGVAFLGPDTYGTPGAAWDADESDGSSDIGVSVTLEPASGYTIQSNRFFTVGLPGVSSANYGDAIRGCASDPVSIDQSVPVDAGGMGSIASDVNALVNLDPAATFNISTKRIENSCMPGCGPISPRIVPIIVFDIEDFQYKQVHGWTGCPSNDPCLRIVNILGLFVVGSGSGSGLAGHLMLLPGDLVMGSPIPPAGSTFLVRTKLVR